MFDSIDVRTSVFLLATSQDIHSWQVPVNGKIFPIYVEKLSVDDIISNILGNIMRNILAMSIGNKTYDQGPHPGNQTGLTKGAHK